MQISSLLTSPFQVACISHLSRICRTLPPLSNSPCKLPSFPRLIYKCPHSSSSHEALSKQPSDPADPPLPHPTAPHVNFYRHTPRFSPTAKRQPTSPHSSPRSHFAARHGIRTRTPQRGTRSSRQSDVRPRLLLPQRQPRRPKSPSKKAVAEGKTGNVQARLRRRLQGAQLPCLHLLRLHPSTTTFSAAVLPPTDHSPACAC